MIDLDELERWARVQLPPKRGGAVLAMIAELRAGRAVVEAASPFVEAWKNVPAREHTGYRKALIRAVAAYRAAGGE